MPLRNVWRYLAGAVVALSMLATPRTTLAGPNSGGVLLLHANESITYCQDITDYCGQSGLTQCADADVSVSGNRTFVFFAIAHFVEGSSPRLSGLTFGVQYDASKLTLRAFGHCANFELPSGDWPAPGSGTALTWNAPRFGSMTPVYWFAGYNYYAPAPTTFTLAPHPTQGGWFADDSVPANTDPIVAFGQLGFNAPGMAPCPLPPVPGACCFADGTCIVTTAAECSGLYQGDGTSCTPNPCPPPPPPTGACCFADGSCTVATAADCLGVYQGDGTSCTPNPCPQPPPPTGACCFADGSCTVTTAAQCAGSYQGDDTSCAPNPCPIDCSGLDAVRRENAPPPRPAPTSWPNGPSVMRSGPNAGGTLILHTNPALVYTDGVGYCGESNLVRCADAITEVDGDGVAIAFVLAAFPVGAAPRVSAVTFGLDYGRCVVINAWGSCADFELSTLNWPATGEGTAVTWNAAQTSLLTEVYWFAAYVGNGGLDMLRLSPHPTQGGYFADDNVPARLDPIAGFGSLGFNRPGNANCPTPSPDSGACCFADGHCEYLTQSACSGIFQGLFVPCVPNPCPVPVPTGACCFSNGSCIVLTQADCIAQFGNWVGDGTSCTPNPCPQPTGACCFADGSCALTTEAGCTGTFQGSGTTCDPNPCSVDCSGLNAVHRENAPAPKAAPTGWPNGPSVMRPGPNVGGTLILHTNPSLEYTDGDGNFCGQSNLAQCQDAITEFDGDGVAIIYVLAAFPDGSQPRLSGVVFGIDYGRCLVIDAWGSCGDFELSTPNWPAHDEGTAVAWMVPHTTHLTEVYWFAAYVSNLGADALNLIPHPTQGAYFADDSVPSRLDAVAGLGSFGFNRPGEAPCPAALPNTGACCFEDGHCEQLTQASCDAGQGNYQGDDVPCVPNPCPQPPPTGACCFEDGSCTVGIESECAGDYQGDGTGCAPNPCLELPGACCLPVGGCAQMQRPECDEQHGVWGGYGTLCDAVTCPPTGACCFEDGSCIALIEAVCALYNGLYQGAGSTCDPNPCPQPGACCYPDGSCQLLTAATCASNGGESMGDGSVCDPNPCVPLPGACCLAEGGCQLLAFEDCAAQFGLWSGYGVQCDAVSCPSIGACCFDDGTCRELIANACYALGANYHGDGVSCDPNPCPQPAACCFLDGSCQVLQVWNCVGQQGTFHEDSATCDPNPCPQPCNLRPVVHWQNAPDPLPRPMGWPPSVTAARGTRGANASGALVLHTNPSLVYTDGSGPYCGQDALSSCDNAITRHDGIEPAVIFAMAAFPLHSHPRMAGITFGVSYGNCVVLDAWGPCADFELPTEQWPMSGEGTALTWNVAQTGLLTNVYWFAAYAYEGRIDQLSLVPHPTQGAYFADDGAPPELDPIAFLGSFGFNQDGQLWCPAPVPATGGCCLLDGTCVVTTASQCIGAHGTYYGDDMPCEGAPCDPRGACCIGTSCVIYTSEECANHGGVYHGDGTPCSSGLCGGGGGCALGPASGHRGDEAKSVGFNQGTLQSSTSGLGCGTLNLNADGGYENGYAWQYGGVVAPTYGAFAECYSGANVSVCSAVFDFTQVGFQSGQCMDVYVWSDAGGCPGSVLCVKINVNPGTIAFWPSLSRHVVDLSGCCVDGNFWVGFWGNWPGQIAPWYVGADLDGFGGCPLTNIAPGIGYPTGWLNVSQVWGPTQALGIGCETSSCGAIAVQKMSWGKVKEIYSPSRK